MTIELDQLVEEDLDNVQEIITAVTPGPRAPQVLRGTLYKTVIKEFTDDPKIIEVPTTYVAAYQEGLDVFSTLRAYEQAVAVFRTAALELRKEMDVLTLEQRLGARQRALEEQQKLQQQQTDEQQETRQQEPKEEVHDQEADELQKQITDAVMFSNRYALYFAGQVGLALLDSEAADVKNMFSFGKKNDASTDRDYLTAELARVATRDLTRVVDEKKAKDQEVTKDDLKYTLESIFTSWTNQFNWKTWDGIAEQYDVENTKLKFGKFSLETGEFKKKYDVITISDRVMQVHKENIIGNREFKEQVWQYLLRLTGYDFERKTNPWNPPQTIFTFGHPGCGKTMGYDALMRSFAETVCKPRGIPITIDVLSIEAFGSEYKDKAPLQLAAYRDKIAHDQGLWVMRASDIDTFMPASRAGGLSQEESKLNGVFFSFFDGSVIQKNGRYAALLDANHVDNLDPALKSRLAVKIELPRFDTVEDFAAISKFYLTNGREGVPVTDDQWTEVGQYLLGTELSNREISNVMGDLAGKFEITEEMVGLPYDQKVAIIVDHNKNLTKNTVMDAFEHYVTTTMDIERKSREAKVRQRIEQHKLDLQITLDDTHAGSGQR